MLPQIIVNTDKTVTRRAIKHWDKDGVKGGPCSNSVLISWLCEDGNFRRWRGQKGQRGPTKESLIAEILKKLEENEITYRNKRDVRNRIQFFFAQFEKAQEWLERNEQDMIEKLRQKDLPENQIASTLKDAVRGQFAYYYDLEDVMVSQPDMDFSGSSYSEDVGDSNEILLGSEGSDEEIDEVYDDEIDEVNDDDDLADEVPNKQVQPTRCLSAPTNGTFIAPTAPTAANTDNTANTTPITPTAPTAPTDPTAPTATTVTTESTANIANTTNTANTVNTTNTTNTTKTANTTTAATTATAAAVAASVAPSISAAPAAANAAIAFRDNFQSRRRARDPLEECLTDALRRSDKALKEKFLLQERRFEAEQKRYQEEERHYRAEEARANTMLQLEQRKLEIDISAAADERAKAQVSYAQMWRSLGLSSEEIIEKIKSNWP